MHSTLSIAMCSHIFASIGTKVKGRGSSGMIKVNERRTLHDVLKEPNFVIPEIPGLFVLLSHWTLFFSTSLTLSDLSSLLVFGFIRS